MENLGENPKVTAKPNYLEIRCKLLYTEDRSMWENLKKYFHTEDQQNSTTLRVLIESFYNDLILNQLILPPIPESEYNHEPNPLEIRTRLTYNQQLKWNQILIRLPKKEYPFAWKPDRELLNTDAVRLLIRIYSNYLQNKEKNKSV